MLTILEYIKECEMELGKTFQPPKKKLLTCWYRVHPKLKNIYPKTSSHNWGVGCAQRGTLLHRWWEYPKLTQLWNSVKAQIFHLNDSRLHYIDLVYLPHNTAQSKKSIEVGSEA